MASEKSGVRAVLRLDGLVQWMLVAGLAGLYLAGFAARMPWNMDELIGFQAMACAERPNLWLNTFRGACGSWDLALWGERWLPLRSYEYTGSLPGWLYWPLYKVWPSPLSARMLGVLALAVQAGLIGAALRLPVAAVFAALLAFLPYSLPHVLDLGPVAFQVTTVIAIWALGRRWRSALALGDRGSWAWPLLAGVLAALGLWSKLAYLFVVPGLPLAFAAGALGSTTAGSLDRAARWRGARQLAGGAAVAALPAAGLLSARTRGGGRYLDVLRDANLGATDLAALAERFEQLFLRYVANPLTAAHGFVWSPGRWTVLGVTLVAALAALGLWGGAAAWRSDRRRLASAGLLAVGAVVTGVLVTASGDSRGMHHLVLAYPCFVLALFVLLAPLAGRPAARLALVAWLGLGVALHAALAARAQEHADPRADRRLPEIARELDRRFGADAAIVLVDWGLYYVMALYGSEDQVVLNHWGLTRSQQLEAVRRAAAPRRLVVVGKARSSSDWALIRRELPDATELDAPGFGRWRVLYEPPAAP